MHRSLPQLALFLTVILGLHSPLLAQQSQQRYMPAPTVVPAIPLPGRVYEAVPPPAPSGVSPGVRGPRGETITLDQSCDLALGNNPVLRKARAQIDSKTGLAIQAGIMPNPRYDTNNPQVFAGNQSQYNAGFCQELPVKGKLRLDRAAAQREVEQSRMSYIRQRYELLTSVRQQFYRVLAQERRVEVLEQLVKIATNSHAVAQQRERAGRVAETDVLLLFTELQQAEIALANSRTLLAGSRRALAATIGIPDLLIQDALGDLKANSPEFDEMGLRQFVATQNAAVIEARLQIEQDQILLQRARVEPYPNPYIGPAVGFGPSSSSSGNSGSQFWLNLQMNIPVWNLNQGNIRAANANVRDSVASVDIVRNDLLRQAADTLATYRAAHERSRYMAERILPTAERTQQLVQNAYDIGRTDVSPVLQAQRALTQVNLDYVDALENAWTNAAILAGLLQIDRFP